QASRFRHRAGTGRREADLSLQKHPLSILRRGRPQGKKAMIKQTVMTLALALAFGAPALAANEAHDHGHAAGEAKLMLNHGQKWQTDAPLRQGMENMRAAIAGELKTIHADKASAAQYEALAARLEGEVAYVVQNCKLDPEA